jgi:phosphatidylglycerol lysyltransferase
MKRAWVLRILAVAAIWVVVIRFAEIERLAVTLVQARWEWLALAAGLQLLFYALYTVLYQVSFGAVGVESRTRDLLPVMFASVFVNVAAPGSGTALWVDDAIQRGQSGARAAAGTVLVKVADFSTFLLVLVIGLAYLLARHELRTYEVVGAVLLLLIIGGWTALLLLGVWLPGGLERLLGFVRGALARLFARLGRRPPLGEDWARRNTEEFRAAGLALRERPRRLAAPMALGMLAQIVDVLSLYALFLAFGEPATLGLVVTGFAVGVLFWIVAITPQGIGVVEGIMPLALASLGVPATKALAITVGFRGLGFWLPFVVGFALVGRVRSFRPTGRRRLAAATVEVVALLTGLMGVINVLSAITPSLPGRLRLIRGDWPLEVRHGGHLAAALAGFGLVALAGGLLRRKRTAWLLTIAVLAVSVVSHLLKGLDFEEAGLAAALAVWLLLLRSHFQALSDPPSVRQGLTVLAGACVATLAYGVAGFFLLDHHFRANFGFTAALRQTVVMFTEFYDPGLQPITGFGRFFAQSIYLVGAVTFGYALYMLIRPVLMHIPASAEARKRAHAIVEAHGRSSLAWFALLEDKHYFFSSGGSVVAFVVKGRVALTLGDPIGPVDDAAAAISEFQARCRRHDWQPAFFQVLPDYVEHYRAAAFTVAAIGHEAIVGVHTFDLAGKTTKTIRTSVHRLTREGYNAEVLSPPVPQNVLTELREISDEWLATMHGAEKRFSLGWFDDDYIRDAPVMVVRAAGGAITAFANIVTEYQLNEVTVDLMRHRSDAESGTMDFLFVKLIEWAKGEGYDTFNLGLSPLAGVGEQAGDPMAERAFHFVYENISRFYDFKGLHRFKSKFRPTWSPRYVVYPGTLSLPAVLQAIVRAQSGDAGLLGYLR